MAAASVWPGRRGSAGEHAAGCTDRIRRRVVSGDTLWAITCLFNPCGYRSRLRNYRVFRAHLPLPLVTVELAFDDRPFELDASDAERLVQIRGGDRMWQKERLLNVALQHLPHDCDKVVWTDCDTVFPEPEWPKRVGRSLDTFRMVQVFSELIDLQSASNTGDPRGPLNVTGGVLREIACGRVAAAALERAQLESAGRSTRRIWSTSACMTPASLAVVIARC